MPKILNLTNEEKAERYDKRFRRHNFTIEEKAEKWDAYRVRTVEDNKKYASKNPELIKRIATEHYEKNKVELNKNKTIRNRKIRELKKADTTEL